MGCTKVVAKCSARRKADCSAKPWPRNDDFVPFLATRKTSKANGEKIEGQSLEGKLGAKIH
jgi:hypothetical protein